jgi:hypothetical protein
VETVPPSHSKGRQLAQTGAEMMVNMVPVFGGTIAVALTVALNHKLNERRERWFTELPRRWRTFRAVSMDSTLTLWRRTRRSWTRS